MVKAKFLNFYFRNVREAKFPSKDWFTWENYCSLLHLFWKVLRSSRFLRLMISLSDVKDYCRYCTVTLQTNSLKTKFSINRGIAEGSRVLPGMLKRYIPAWKTLHCTTVTGTIPFPSLSSLIPFLFRFPSSASQSNLHAQVTVISIKSPPFCTRLSSHLSH